MDTTMLRNQLSSGVPFNRHVGVEALEVEAGRGVARLQQSPTLFNHVGTLHAGALFTLADVASGAAVAGMFADEIGQIALIVSKAEITFSRPARGTVTALAAATEERGAIAQRLERDRRAELEVGVRIIDDSGTEVASIRVHWHLRRRVG